MITSRKILRSTIALSSTLLVLSPLSQSGWADTVTLTGVAGVPGIDGTTGNPGTDGTDGGSGEDISATAGTAGQSNNSATATGGAGGDGGDGGEGSGTNADGGDGGDGGAGGEATSVADTNVAGGDTTAHAQSNGGNGGNGGHGGQATGSGTDGLAGNGGSGGDSYVSASTTQTGTSGLTKTTGTAKGGRGGTSYDSGSGGAGGYANTIASANSTNSNNISNVVSTGTSTGGEGGTAIFAVNGTAGNGGKAYSLSTATSSGNQQTSAYATTTGGAGGNISGTSGNGGYGGNADATAQATQLFSTTTMGSSARATSVGGAGGVGYGVGFSGGDGGTSTATSSVTGNSSGAADSWATATGGRGGQGTNGADGGAGGEATLVDAASGTNIGNLQIVQIASGGVGGAAVSGIQDISGNGGNGGFATSTLSSGASAAGRVDVDVTATGGAGGNASFNGTGGDGGGVEVSSTGQSTGGNIVEVTAKGVGGNGGSAVDGQAGKGAAVSLVDTVNGSTTGRLILSQTASGGNGGRVYGSGSTGEAGSALSYVTHVEQQAAIVTVNTVANGGNGGDRGTSGKAGNGATGTAETIVTSDSGTAYGTARTFGGDGGRGLTGDTASGGKAGNALGTVSVINTGTLAPDTYAANANTYGEGGAGGYGYGSGVGGNGGDATMSAVAESTVIDNGGQVAAYSQAMGGAGGGSTFSSAGMAGAGGNAHSTSTALAAGNQYTVANDVARGGHGGIAIGGPGNGGDGGDAISTSYAEKNTSGTQILRSTADAQAGNGSHGQGSGYLGGDGGDAIATATGLSAGGEIAVSATATAGHGGEVYLDAAQGQSGSAVATATGSGTSGSVNSSASSSAVSGLVTKVQTTASAQVGSTSTAQSRAAYGADLSSVGTTSGQQASAFATAMPDGTVLLPEVRDSAVLANFNIANGSTVFQSSQFNSDVIGYGVLGGAGSPDGGPTDHAYNSTIDFAVDTSKYANGTQKLLLGALSPQVLGDGFTDSDGTSMTFQVRVENKVIDSLSKTFTNSADALAFFKNQTLEIDTSTISIAGPMNVQLAMEVHSTNPDDGFVADFVLGNSEITHRAVPYIADTAVNLGEMHTGDATTSGIAISNVAANGSDGANAKFTATTGNAATNNGAISSLAPGSTDSSTMQVGIDSSSSGEKSGTATILLQTDGTVSGKVEDFGQEEIAVTGTVFDYAQAGVSLSATPEYVRVNDAVDALLTISNNAAANGYSEKLDAAFTDSTNLSTSGSIDNLDAGSTSQTMSVSLDTSNLGLVEGSATVGFISDGDGINSLGQTVLGDHLINVATTVTQLASGSVQDEVNFGNVHVGDVLADRTVLVTNTRAVADADFTDYLNAEWDSANSIEGITFGGSVSGLAAGTFSTALTVGLDTSNAGSINGMATVNLFSDGTRFGFGLEDIGAEDVSILAAIETQADVYRYANPVITETAINLGNIRAGSTSPAMALSITNDVPNDGFSEALNATIGAVTGNAFGSGAINLLAPSNTDTLSMMVGINALSAGHKEGTVTLDFASNGEDSSGLGITALPSQDVTVSADVFRLAQGAASAGSLTFFSRVGDTVSQDLLVDNTALADGYSESLDASASSTGNGISSISGSKVTALKAGDTATMTVKADTDTSGVFLGGIEIDYMSNGQELGLGDNIALGNQYINVTTTVFDLAEATVTDAIDFGTVRIGTDISQLVTVQNKATGGLVDQLVQTSATADAPFTLASLSAPGLSSGESAGVEVQMDTTVAGVYSGAASMGFTSRNNYLTDVDLGLATIALSGTVNNLAEALIVDVNDASDHATLTGEGNSYILDFGSLLFSDLGGLLKDEIGISNTAAGPADVLGGAFALPELGAFGVTGMSDFAGLAAGDVHDGLWVELDTSHLTLGLYERTITLNPYSSLAGFDDYGLGPIDLTFRAYVTGSADPVPEPTTLLLFGSGLAGIIYSRRKGSRKQNAAI